MINKSLYTIVLPFDRKYIKHKWEEDYCGAIAAK